VTLRYHGPRPFDTYPLRSDNGPIGCASGEAVLLGLLDEIVDRLADVLERAGRDIDAMSAAIFRRRRQPGTPAARGARPATPSQDFRALLDEIGSKGDLLSNLRYSLLSIERLVGFLVQAAVQRKADKVVRAQIESLRHDSNSLLDHAGFLSTKVTFLLDATLGMIGIEQNAIIKIFSVAAVAFLPPTLIASIYGMNFAAMPELAAPWGYPVALAAMVVSAVVPLWFFRRRGWL
jgi:magnesium transporter